MHRAATLLVLAITAAASAEPVIHEVKSGPFKVELELTGVFEASKMHTILAELDDWQTLKVVEWASQGAAVKSGDVVLRYDTREIDKAIADAEVARSAAAVALQDAEAELAAMEKTVPLDLAKAERDNQRALENLARWNKVDKDLYVMAARNSLDSAKFVLDYESEELRQLEKMYAEDSITEDTEEIILKRQQRSVLLAGDAVKDAKARHEFAMGTDLVRRQEDFELGVERSELNLAKLRQTLPLSLEAKRRAVAKMRHDNARAEEKIARLGADREKMAVKATAAGVVYYGDCVQGKWPQADAVAATLRPNGPIKPGTVMMTIVEPRPLTLRAPVKEADLLKAPTGAGVSITPTAFPEMRLKGKVAAVAPLPLADGYPVTIDADLPRDAEAIRAGMTAKATITAYSANDAISVPRAALKHNADGEALVTVRSDDGSTKDRKVKLGWTTDKLVEITDGLKTGEKVHAGEAPSPAPAAPAQDSAKK